MVLLTRGLKNMNKMFNNEQKVRDLFQTIDFKPVESWSLSENNAVKGLLFEITRYFCKVCTQLYFPPSVLVLKSWGIGRASFSTMRWMIFPRRTQPMLLAFLRHHPTSLRPGKCPCPLWRLPLSAMIKAEFVSWAEQPEELLSPLLRLS